MEMIIYFSVIMIRTIIIFKEEFVLMVIVLFNIVVKTLGVFQCGLKVVKLLW